MSYNPSNTFSDARLTLARHLTEYPSANNGEYPSDISQFSDPACCENICTIINTIAPFALKIRSWKTVRFSEQVIPRTNIIICTQEARKTTVLSCSSYHKYAIEGQCFFVINIRATIFHGSNFVFLPLGHKWHDEEHKNVE